LVDLIDPVAVKQVRVAAPPIRRPRPRVVAGVVVDRHPDRLSVADVAVVFLLQRAAVVFEVIEDVERAPARVLDQAGTDLVAADQGCKPNSERERDLRVLEAIR